MIGLPKEAGEYADAKVRGILSKLPFKTVVSDDDFCIGYIFGGNWGEIFPDSYILKYIIGKSESTLALNLGSYNESYLCGKVPYSGGGTTRILHKKPPTNIEDNIAILNKILAGYEVIFPFCEDRSINDPHPDFSPEKLAILYDKAKREILTNPRFRKLRGYDEIKEPEFEDRLYYTLSEDLTKGGKFNLYDLSHLYALEFSETEQHPLKSEGGWSWDEGSEIQFVANLQDIAKNITGGMKKLRELMAIHFGACNKIISGLIKGDYQLSYVAYTGSHDRMIYAVKAMFSIRISQEDGIADLVVHDPRNILLKKVV